MRAHPLSLLSLLLLAASACGPADRPPAAAVSKPGEAWDHQNDPRIFGLSAARYDELSADPARRGTTEVKPWKDSYWPYYRKNLAFRYASSSEFYTFAEQAADAFANPGNAQLSPAEKYDLLSDDPQLTLTAESWSRYDSYFSRYGDDLGKWGWMGICNGWAPASLNEPAPVTPVLGVSPQGREVLLYDGDLRALLSKAYDSNKMSESIRLIGNRCNDPVASVPRDPSGRPLDGMVMGTGKAFTIATDYLAAAGAMEVRDRVGGPAYWLLAAGPVRKVAGEVAMWVYGSRADVAADVAAGTRGTRATGGQARVHLYRACRDVNPATLHQAMTQMLSDAAPEKHGFIIELSRNHEVWNHPVWGFETSLGEPRPVAEEPAAERVFRAPGAAYVVDATTRILYINGANPRTAYPEDDVHRPVDWDRVGHTGNRYAVLDIEYSLEFDASGLLVGGEWKDDPDRSMTPDFFWRTYGTLTDDGARGGPSVIRYSLVKRLLECSQRQPDAEYDAGAGPIGVVRCQL